MILRGEILKELLSNFIYPNMEQALRIELMKQVENHVIYHACKKFKSILNLSWIKRENTEKQTFERVIAIVGEPSKDITGVCVDQTGGMVESFSFEVFLNENQNLNNASFTSKIRVKTHFF